MTLKKDGVMITDKEMAAKIKRHHLRKSLTAQRYYVNQLGRDHIVWRALCALHTQERIEKDQKRYLTVQDMIWLIAMKQYVAESGSDKFYMRDIKRFINFNFKAGKSALSSVNRGKNLLRAGYVRLESELRPQGGYILTMKARAFYRDLGDLFSI